MAGRELLVLFLAMNALFWALMPHRDHCRLAGLFGVTCIAHWQHITLGVACFLVATYVAQKA